MEAPNPVEPHPSFLVALSINALALGLAVGLFGILFTIVFNGINRLLFNGYQRFPLSINYLILILEAIILLPIPCLCMARFQLNELCPSLSRSRKIVYYVATAVALPTAIIGVWFVSIQMKILLEHLVLAPRFPEFTDNRMNWLLFLGMFLATLLAAAMMGVTQMVLIRRPQRCVNWSLSLMIPRSIGTLLLYLLFT